MLRRARRQAPEPVPVRRRVLVVAEDEGSGELLTRLLRRAGYEAAMSLTDSDSDDTNTLSRIAANDVGCVVLDLGAGQPNGLRRLDAIRSHGDAAVSGVQIVVLGDHAQHGALSRQPGADSFLVRPFHADDFLRKVAETMTRPDTEPVRRRPRHLTETGGREPS